jgi:polysaccharide export outer membrane protein
MNGNRILPRAALLLVTGFAGCATLDLRVTELPPVEHPSPTEAQVEEPYLINVGDQVEVKFPYRQDFNQTQTVGDDGKITLPLLPPVTVVGMTPENLRNALNDLYGSKAYDPVANRQEAASRTYLIGVGDGLDLRFDFQPEYNERVTVRPDGKISLPRIRTVVAEGKTPEELEKELTERYRPVLKDPSLTLIVRNTTSDLLYTNGHPTRLGVRDLDDLTVAVRRTGPQLIYVAGEVGNPGVFPYRAPMTALRAVVSAGGYKRTSKLDSVIILRKAGTGEALAMKVNLRPEIEGCMTTDVALKPYDIVIVPKTCIAKVQDVLDQYVYNPVPATRNVFFNFFYNLNPQAVPNPALQLGAPR